MFDDQPITNKAQVPGNLPISEPEDILADAEPTEQPVSALDRGILRPKQAEPTMITPPAEIYAVKEPVLTRGIITVVVVVVALGILGGGGWWIYNSFIKTSVPVMPTGLPVVAPVEETTPVDIDQPPAEEPAPVVPLVEENTQTTANENVAKEMADEEVLFGKPMDKDDDGLDDAKEAELGTDPNNWDSDSDNLSDGDEVLTWKTNPMNPDTDNDTFLDGNEVKNGYNPAGPGKIFEVPKK